MMRLPLVLASSSFYRRALLARLRLPFETLSPNIDEQAYPNEAADVTACRLAKEKALAVQAMRPHACIIASDQVASLDGQQIGKPGNHANALKQLQTMRGRQVIFYTALCVLTGNHMQSACVPTRVRFRQLLDEELENYLSIDKPYDCAGSVKNEGLGIALLKKIEGDDPTALTGLPLIRLCTMLRQVGVVFFAAAPPLGGCMH